MKVPTIQVPATLYLDLLQAWLKQPQEHLDRSDYIEACQLELRACRKINKFLAESQIDNSSPAS